MFLQSSIYIVIQKRGVITLQGLLSLWRYLKANLRVEETEWWKEYNNNNQSTNRTCLRGFFFDMYIIQGYLQEDWRFTRYLSKSNSDAKFFRISVNFFKNFHIWNCYKHKDCAKAKIEV